MLLEIFFWGYIVLMLFLALKRYLPYVKRRFDNHPIGEWAMYSVPVEIKQYSAFIVDNEGKSKDITEISKKFLWHNFADGKFVSISHPDFPKHTFQDFANFLSIQKEVIYAGKGFRARLNFSYIRNGKFLKYEALSEEVIDGN